MMHDHLIKAKSCYLVTQVLSMPCRPQLYARAYFPIRHNSEMLSLPPKVLRSGTGLRVLKGTFRHHKTITTDHFSRFFTTIYHTPPPPPKTQKHQKKPKNTRKNTKTPEKTKKPTPAKSVRWWLSCGGVACPLIVLHC